jgi:hypothetical protein
VNNLKPNWQVEFETTNKVAKKIQEKDSNASEKSVTNTKDDTEKVNEKDEKNNNEIINNEKNKIVFTLSCSEQGQLGVFPEQQENWKWIGDSIRKALEFEKKENEKKNINIINPDEVISEDYSPRKEYSKKAQKATPPPVSQKNHQNTKKKDTENSKDLPIRKFLNGFAYTGGSSLAALSVNDISFETVISSDNIMSSSALQVVHLDAAKSSVQWAMRNAVASGLITSSEGDSISDNDGNDNSNSPRNSDSDSVNTENENNSNQIEKSGMKIIEDKNRQPSVLSPSQSPLSPSSSSSSPLLDPSSTSFSTSSSARWITDDCLTFLEREIRRGNKYDGLIFDPPAFGRASSGKIWKLEKDLPILVEELIPQLLSSDPLFVLLSCHDVSWPPERLAEILSVAMSSVMKNAMLLNIKAMKKSKANESKNAQVISKNVKNDKDKDKLKDNEKNKNSTAKKGPKKAPENSDRNIQSVFLAGGILEYGPMILSPNKVKNNVRKLQIGNPLPLGGFARWSKIID